MATMTLLQSSFISPIKHNQRCEMGLSGLPPGSFYFFIFTLSKVLHPCLLLFDVIPHFFASYGSTTFLLRLFSHFNTAKCRVILDRFIFNFQTFSFYCKNYGLEMLVFITVVVFYNCSSSLRLTCWQKHPIVHRNTSFLSIPSLPELSVLALHSLELLIC